MFVLLFPLTTAQKVGGAVAVKIVALPMILNCNAPVVTANPISKHSLDVAFRAPKTLVVAAVGTESTKNPRPALF